VKKIFGGIVMKKIMLIIAAIFILNFNFASAAEVWTLPEKGLQLQGEEKQNYISKKLTAFFHPAPDAKPVAINFEVPDGWNYEKFSLDGLPCEVLENPAADTERVVLQLHGGGYVASLRDNYRNFDVKQAVVANAKQIFMVDYRLAPQNIFPAAQEDAVKIYKEILNRGVNPKNIIVIGDSAGGNLTLSLAVYLKENNLPQPKILVLISAWGTLENNLPSRKNNFNRDYVLGVKGSPLHTEVAKASYASGLNKKNPQISPIYADLKNFPAMLIQAGGYEVLLDDSLELAKKATADDVKFTLTVYPEMPHDFVVALPEMQESVDLLHEIKNFIDENMDD